MAGQFEATVVIDRPIEEVFAFLSDGENDPRSKNIVTAPEGGYDLAPEGDGTRVRISNVLEGHGFGKLIAPLALRSARKGADDFGQSIKRAVEGA
jgi:hypothetical protein